MSRVLMVALLAPGLAVAAEKPATGNAGILELKLPLSAYPPSWAPDRVSRLEVDGKDYTRPRLVKRSITVEPKKGSDTVTVVYTFWPNTYTRFTRTKVVKVDPGQTVAVSFDKPDPGRPDQIYVIYYPTPVRVVDAMCQMAKVGPVDIVYDIGCGDGRLVIQAVKKFGAKKGVGIDLSADRIKEARAKAKAAGVSDRVRFLQKDALTMEDFSEATVVLLYLSNDLNVALRPKLRKTLKPGARVVSHRFLMGDWKPEKTQTMRAKNNAGKDDEFKLHLWTISKP